MQAKLSVFSVGRSVDRSCFWLCSLLGNTQIGADKLSGAAEAQSHKAKPSLIQHRSVLVGRGLKVLQCIIHSCGMRLASSKLWSRSCFVQGLHLVNATIQKCAHIAQRTDYLPQPHPPAPHVHRHVANRLCNKKWDVFIFTTYVANEPYIAHEDCMCSCTCLSNSPTFFRLVSSPSWLFWNSFLKCTMEANFSCSSSRNVLSPWFSSTFTSNSKTSSSILPNFFVHWMNFALSNSSPNKSKQAKNQNASNQSNWKQIKSIKLTSNQIKSNQINAIERIKTWKNHIKSKQLKANN